MLQDEDGFESLSSIFFLPISNQVKCEYFADFDILALSASNFLNICCTSLKMKTFLTTLWQNINLFSLLKSTFIDE